MKITVAAKTEAAGFENLQALLNDMGCKNVKIEQRQRQLGVTLTPPRMEQLYFSAGPDPQSAPFKMLQALKKDKHICKYTGVKVRSTDTVVIFTIDSN
jgi:hypothetical protein